MPHRAQGKPCWPACPQRRSPLSSAFPEKAVSKHAAGIFGKLDLAPSDDDNQRVLAVLAYLGA